METKAVDVSVEDLKAGRRALMGGSVGAAAPFTVARALGSEVWGTDGKRYIDCTAQAWSLSVGHCHPRVVAAVRKHLGRYSHIRTSFDTEPKLLLAKRLVDLAPEGLNRVAFCLSGSEAVEGAMKLALRNRGGKRSQTFVSLWDGYHGRTFGTMAVSWPHPQNPFSEWMGPVVRIPQAYCYRCPVGRTYPSCEFECVHLAREILNQNLTQPPAAILMEPFQGNGGMVEFPPGYLEEIRKLADDFGTLLILDEIQTGIGRMGAWFACQAAGVVPDLLVIGKGLGGGFPLFATLVRDGLDGFESGDHSFTFAHFSPSMVAALETLDIIQEEGLLERSRRLGGRIRQQLILNLQKRYGWIGDIRGIGLMIALELVEDPLTKAPARSLAAWFVRRARELGLLLGESKYAGLGNVVKFKPPLNIPDYLVEEALEILARVCREVDQEERW